MMGGSLPADLPFPEQPWACRWHRYAIIPHISFVALIARNVQDGTGDILHISSQ